MDDIFKRCRGFQWDGGNSFKNQEKHGVTKEECEEVFFNRPLLIFDDERHSDKEQRYLAAGVTGKGRCLSVIFTIRADLIRIISSRDMNKKERRLYREKEAAQNTKI